MKDEKLILEKLEKIGEDVNEIKVKTAKMEEHLSALNGSDKRHDASIKDLYEKHNKFKDFVNSKYTELIKGMWSNRVEIAKWSVGTSMIVSVSFLIVRSLLP